MHPNLVNFNVGVVGHIDSGKTSLARALSTTASTASFDKCPQSQERGITVDLGFSSFEIPATGIGDCRTLQFTLVDCPGHASLIRTIIGGSQIIDMMLLVVDVTKGMQTQTAECLVLGEITTSKMIVVLNKVDLLEDEPRNTLVEKMRKKMQKTMERTKFAGCPIVSVAAKPGGSTTTDQVDSRSEPIGLDALIAALRDAVELPKRDPTGPFIFAVDHCFSIRGQGTVMTGTVLSGTVTIGNNVEVPSIKEVRKVKSIQMFRTPVESASQGDRAGICVTQFDAKLVERGLLCSPGLIATTYAAIASVRPIRFYKGRIRTKAKFHVSLGHSTVMASCHFFESISDKTISVDTDAAQFDWSAEYAHCDELNVEESSSRTDRKYFALLQFERPVTVPPSNLVIGSRLDADIHVNSCRLAFEGRFVHGIEDRDYAQTLLPFLKVFNIKSKEGIVDRMIDPHSVIVRSLFKRDSNTQHFVGMRVRLSHGETGFIDGNFGQSGKIKIRVPEGLKEETLTVLNAFAKKRSKKSNVGAVVDPVVDVEHIKISLTFKRYVFDKKKTVVQSTSD